MTELRRPSRFRTVASYLWRHFRFPKSRLARVAIGVFAFFVIAYLIITQSAKPYLRHRIEVIVSKRMNAKLSIGSISYLPPYGVRVDDAQLIGPGPQGVPSDLLDIRRLDLHLAKLPIGGGPLVFERINISQPVVHIFRKPENAPPQQKLFKRRPTTVPADEPDLGGRKLSEILRLKELTIDGGEVMYKDLRKPASPPLVLKLVDVTIHTTQHGPADYDFTIDAVNRPLASLSANGSINVDTTQLLLNMLKLEARAEPGRPPEQLPPEVQSLLKSYNIGGSINLTASGSAVLKSLATAKYDLTIALHDASATVPKWDAALDRLDVVLHCAGVGRRVDIRIAQFIAGSGDTILSIADGASLLLDGEAGRWSLEGFGGWLNLGGDRAALPVRSRAVFHKFDPRGRVDFAGHLAGPLGRDLPRGGAYVDLIEGEVLAYPRQAQFTPARFVAPITMIEGGPIRFAHGVISFQALTGRYGNDQFNVTSARLAVAPMLEKQYRYGDIAGNVVFHRPNPPYPLPFGKTIEALEPQGEYDLAGWFWLDKTRLSDTGKLGRPNYDLLISSDDGSMALTKRRIPFTHIKGDAEIVPTLLRIKDLRADVAGGTLTGMADVKTKKPVAYNGTAAVQDVNLKQLAELYGIHDPKRGHIDGKGSIRATFSGGAAWEGQSQLDRLEASDGVIQVDEGDFWQIPLFHGVAGGAKVKDEALTVGEVAAFFTVKDRTVHLSDAAINAPALGVQGGGDVAFDGALDLHMVAAPLADWRENLQKAGIPLVGDVAGAIQKLLNTATGTLLYDLRVTGTLKKPEIAVLPAPVLTKTAAALFGSLAAGNSSDHLDDRLRDAERAGQRKSAAK